MMDLDLILRYKVNQVVKLVVSGGIIIIDAMYCNVSETGIIRGKRTTRICNSVKISQMPKQETIGGGAGGSILFTGNIQKVWNNRSKIRR